jgi:hypothetical protein
MPVAARSVTLPAIASADMSMRLFVLPLASTEILPVEVTSKFEPPIPDPPVILAPGRKRTGPAVIVTVPTPIATRTPPKCNARPPRSMAEPGPMVRVEFTTHGSAEGAQRSSATARPPATHRR